MLLGGHPCQGFSHQEQGAPQGALIRWREQESGESECPAVMVGIGDETIAPIRKDADFRLVACR